MKRIIAPCRSTAGIDLRSVRIRRRAAPGTAIAFVKESSGFSLRANHDETNEFV